MSHINDLEIRKVSLGWNLYRYEVGRSDPEDGWVPWHALSTYEDAQWVLRNIQRTPPGQGDNQGDIRGDNHPE